MLNKSEHQRIMLDILKQIYSNPKLAPLLGFKGGTALYFCYELPRFSVDLDFNLLDLKQENFVFDRVLDILKKYGEVKIADNKRLSLHYSISYQKNLPKLKVDISKRNYGTQCELKNVLGLAMNVMKLEDMFACKLIAASERSRTAIRDLYDLNYMFNKLWNYNSNIIEERSKLSVRKYFEHLITVIENYDPVNILSEIGELLSDKDKAYVKDKLKSDLLFSLRAHLSFIDAQH